MTLRIAAGLVVLGCVAAAPVVARADLMGSSVTLEGFGGWQSLNVPGHAGVGGTVSSAVSSATEENALVGGDLLLKLGLLGIGLSVDKSLGGSKPWDGSVMAGLLFDLLPSLRLEALGEVGRRSNSTDFGDIFTSTGSTFLGVRPGVSIRLLPTPIRLGVTALIRWRTSGPGADFGSPDYGFIGRVGVEFP